MSPAQARILKILIANEREYYEAKLRGESVLERDMWWEPILPEDKRIIMRFQEIGLVETENRNETQVHARIVEDLSHE